mmetsp:Transcript_7419/g.12542  ORF Transcript_7419/g.12542 Transcript_7419/m.12542 type:complete len:134 (-) Transcript_7419:1626-2027(-)
MLVPRQKSTAWTTLTKCHIDTADFSRKDPESNQGPNLIESVKLVAPLSVVAIECNTESPCGILAPFANHSSKAHAFLNAGSDGSGVVCGNPRARLCLLLREREMMCPGADRVVSVSSKLPNLRARERHRQRLL